MDRCVKEMTKDTSYYLASLVLGYGDARAMRASTTHDPHRQFGI
jgi:hypothetical protein